MTDLWTSKVTIYNDVVEADARLFERFVIEKCQIQGQALEKINGTIRSVANAQTVITKDVEHYKKPADYMALDAEQRADFYTVRPGDFVVFDEVEDVVSIPQEYMSLQSKYKNNGMKVTTVSANINGMAVDNVTMTNV